MSGTVIPGVPSNSAAHGGSSDTITVSLARAKRMFPKPARCRYADGA